MILPFPVSFYSELCVIEKGNLLSLPFPFPFPFPSHSLPLPLSSPPPSLPLLHFSHSVPSHFPCSLRSVLVDRGASLPCIVSLVRWIHSHSHRMEWHHLLFSHFCERLFLLESINWGLGGK